jgi:hypothetical protein
VPWFWIALLGGGVGYLIIVESPRHREMRALRRRPCAGAAWRRRFPGVAPDDIRDYLAIVATCMGMPDSQRLKLRPDDRIIDIYRAAIGGRWAIGDSMELESLIMELEARYRIDTTSYACREITLAQLLSGVIRRRR